MQTSGAMRRENAKLYPPSLRAQRSDPCLRLLCDGLLRRSLSSGGASRRPVGSQ